MKSISPSPDQKSRLMILCLLILFPGTAKSQGGNQLNEITYRQISMESYADKLAGGWMGQAIGVLWGQWTESKWQGEIVPFDLEDWYRIKPEIDEKGLAIEDWKERRDYYQKYINDKNNWEIWTPDKMSDQDDLYIEFLFMASIKKYGLEVTATEMAEDWLLYLDGERVWCANKAAYQNFKKGILPPWSGHPRNTPWGDAIDFQIEADLFGLISPGLPGISNAWCDKVGHMMNYGDGVYAGMAMAAMYSEAFFESDPRKLAEFSLRAIPAESNYAKMVRDVLDLHQELSNWEDAWQKLQAKWGMRNGKQVSAIYVPINGAYVYMGLLYGEGDFWKTMNISMRCGMDSDCNPSSSAGIIGTVLGMSQIPPKWSILRDLPIENISISEIYPELIQWDDIISSTLEIGKWNIIENGGYIEKGEIYIPHQRPTVPPLEQTLWENADSYQ